MTLSSGADSFSEPIDEDDVVRVVSLLTLVLDSSPSPAPSICLVDVEGVTVALGAGVGVGSGEILTRSP